MTERDNAHAPQAGVHLYHFAESTCSKMVRQALAEKGVAYTSHHVLLPLKEQLDPHYVRLNERCMVPTLVVDGKVTTDSVNVCRYLDGKYAGQGTALFPPEGTERRAAVEKAIELWERCPVWSVTHGTYADDPRPAGLKKGANKESIAKQAEYIRELVQQHKDDEFLASAYTNALAHKDGKDDKLGLEGTKASLATLAGVCDELEAMLAEGPFVHAPGGGWLAAPTFTAADLCLGAIFGRFERLGLGPQLWGADVGRPYLAGYVARLTARPSYKQAITAWGTMSIILAIVGRKLGLTSFK